MSNLIIPAGSAIIGAFIGGPTGAQLGWVAGSAYINSKKEIVQPKLGDLRIQTSQYDTPIPYVIGRQRISGNVIWCGPKTEYTTKHRAGKGGPTTITTGYKISCLISLCKGPIVGISRIWADGKLIIDSTVTAVPLIGTVYTGSDTQMPDPTYQSYVGLDAPAYRGLAYIALRDFDLGVSGRLPQFSFEVIAGAAV